MAQFDRLSASVICRYGNGVYTNIIYGQVLDEGQPANQMSGFAALVESKWCENVKKVSVDSMSYDSIIVRRLKPAITDVEVRDINISGDIPQSGLSGTSYTLLRYFAQPYEKGTAFHWKVNGIPMDSNKRGLMTVQGQTRYTDLIEAMTLGPYVQDGNTYAFIRAPKDTDAANVALPAIYKAQVDNTIRNLRSRQVRL